MTNMNAALERQADEFDVLHVGRGEELASEMRVRHAKEFIDALINGATPEQLKLAVESLMMGLTELGFGFAEDISGADAVEAISALYDDVASRILR